MARTDALIDNAFNRQGAQITAQTAAEIGGSAVPEPATCGFICLGASARLARRRRGSGRWVALIQLVRSPD